MQNLIFNPMSLFHKRASRLPIDNKKANARRDGKELRSAQGSIDIPSTSDFSESEFAESYRHGHAGGRTGHHTAPKKVVSASFSDFQESTVVDSPVDRIRYSPEQKTLVQMLSSYAEPQGNFTYSEGQMRALKQLFSDKKLVNGANELQKLRNKKIALTARERSRKMAIESELAKASVAITRIVRTEGE